MFAMRQIGVLASGTFAVLLRTRLLHAAFAVGTAVLLLATVGDRTSAYAQVRVSLDAALAAASLMGHVLAATLGLQLLSGQGHRDGEYAFLCRPLGRETFLLGRAVGVCLLLVTFVAVIGAAAAIGVAQSGHAVPGGYGLACAVLPFELAVTLALCCLFGSASSRPLAATCMAAVWLCGQLSDELRLLAGQQENIATRAALQMGFWLLPDYARLSLRGFAEAGFAQAAPAAAAAMAYGTCFAVCTMGLACAVYARRSRRLESMS